MGTEITTVETWLYSQLSGDAVGVADRVYSGYAPRPATFPLVIFDYQAPEDDLMVVNLSRIWSSGSWIVKVVDRESSLSTLKTIAESIDTILHGQSGSADGGTVVSCYRTQPFKITELIDGVAYRHLGGIYRIRAQT